VVAYATIMQSLRNGTPDARGWRVLAATLLFIEFSIYDELDCVRGDFRGVGKVEQRDRFLCAEASKP